MAEKISVQIALEGGAEIERQLADIGQAGQKAFIDISKSAEQVGGFKELKPEEVSAKLKEMGVTGADAIGKIQKAVQTAGRLESIVQGVQSVETGLAALAAAAPIVGAAIVAVFAAATAAALAFANSVNKISDEAAQLGVSIQKLDQFRAGLDQAGISAQGISAAIAHVNSNLEKAAIDRVTKNFNELKAAMAGGGFVDAGTQQIRELTAAAKEFTPEGKAAAEALHKLGFGIPGTTVKDVQQLGVELARLKGLGIDIKVNDDAITRAQKIIEFLAKMPDQAKAAQIAMQQFGPAGAELVAAFRTDTIGIDQFRERLGTMTAEQEVAANKIRQSSNQLSADWERFKANIGAPIAIAGLAALTSLFEAIKGGIATTVRELVALGTALNAVATVGAEVIRALAAPINLVISAVTSLGSALGSITWDAISGAGVAAWNGLTGVIGQAASAVTDFASKMATIVWDAISGAGVAAWNGLTGVIGQAASAVTDFASKMATIVWDAISGAGVAAWNGLTGAILNAARAVADFFTTMAGGAWEKVKALVGLGGGAPAAPGKARGGLLGGRGTGTSDSNLAWVSRGEYIMPARVVAQPGVASFLEALRRSGNIPSFAGGGSVTAFLDSITRNEERLQELLNNLELVVREGTARFVGGMTQMVGGFAHGGLLGGRGTGTSDSNLAWVSRGEHIMPARAVAQPGVLEFLEALRRSGGNLSRVLDGMGRFALGGMVPRAIPAFATGGLAGGSNVTIQFPGMPAISGLRASSDVVDQLHKAAALAQVRSGGRKPSRYS